MKLLGWESMIKLRWLQESYATTREDIQRLRDEGYTFNEAKKKLCPPIPRRLQQYDDTECQWIDVPTEYVTTESKYESTKVPPRI